jgi:alpha-N-arabinofuranosidase
MRPRRAAALVLACAIPGARAGPDEARVTIDAARVEGRIDPRLYGQFAEFMFEGVKGGLSAELVRDRGFDEAPNSIGLSRHWERYPDDRNDDYGLSFHRDHAEAYPVRHDHFEKPPLEHALRVDLRAGVVERHGVHQPRIPVRAGVGYRGYLWLKASDFAGRVRVALEEDRSGGQVHAEAEIRDVLGDWKQYRFVLQTARDDPHARLAILFEGKGRLWLDQVSLLPNDAVGGVRADVEALVKALRPSFVRWPGGNVAQDYHWRWGVGPRDGRPVWTNLSWKNEPEPGDIGTDEFVAFCRRVGAEPSITVNVEGRGATAEEAAAWVEYCNGPKTSRYGAMRAANGNPEPFAVKYWELGNEIWGDWVRGHTDAESYARHYLRYQQAMRAVDSNVQLIAVGDNDTAWNRRVLRIAGHAIDYLAIHHYYGREAMAGDALNLMARPRLHYQRFYEEVAKGIAEEVSGRSIRLSINEWGLDLPESRQYSIEAALYGARLMHVFERASPFVAMSAVSDLVNGWPGGIIQAGRHGVFVSPLYHVNRLYNEHLGRERLKTTVEGPAFDTSREGRGVPVVDAVASRSADGAELYVKLVNTSSTHDLATSIELPGVAVEPDAIWHVLTAPSPESRNGFATPEAIRPRREVLRAGPRFHVSLPKHSVSVIVVRIAHREARP